MDGLVGGCEGHRGTTTEERGKRPGKRSWQPAGRTKGGTRGN